MVAAINSIFIPNLKKIQLLRKEIGEGQIYGQGHGDKIKLIFCYT